MRARDDVNTDQFAYAARRRRARVSGGLDRRDLAAHDRRDEASAELLVTDQADVRRLDHHVVRFDHRHQPFRLDHSQSFHLFLAPFALLFSLFDNLVAGDHTASVLAVRPLPDHFFSFAQLHAQDLSRQIGGAGKGRLDDAFLLSCFHSLPPHALLTRGYRRNNLADSVNSSTSSARVSVICSGFSVETGLMGLMGSPVSLSPCLPVSLSPGAPGV